MEDDELQHIMSKAEDGDAESQFTLAEWYMDGENGLDEDPVKAVEWLTKAAAQGYKPAIGVLGYRIFIGEGIECNREYGKELMRIAVDAGDSRAHHYLGMSYVDEGNLEEAFRIFQKGHDLGDEDSSIFRANMFALGLASQGREQAGLDILEQYYAKGNALAAYCLGNYFKANNEPLRAVECYERGGLFKAAGDLYVSMERYEDAVGEYMRGYEGGNAESMVALGKMYIVGLGVEKDIEMAEVLYKTAADKGSSAAMVSLGQMQEGRHNLEEAERWYRKALAADSECRDAELNLKLLGLSSFERLIKTTLLENKALDRFIREESWEQANNIVEELRATYSRRPDRAQISYYCCLDQKTHYLEIMLDDCPYRMRDKAFVSWIRYHLMITHGDLSPEEQIVLNEHIWRSQQGERGQFISPYAYITRMGRLIYELERPYVTLTWLQAITPCLVEDFKNIRDGEDNDAEYWSLRAALVASDVIYAHLVAKHFPSDSSCTERVNEIEGFVNTFDNPIDEWSENELNLIDFFIKSIIPLYEENGLRESLLASWKVASTFCARTMRVKLAEKYESLIKSALES